MSYNIAEYIIGWGFNVLHDGEKWRIYLKLFEHLINEVFKRTSTYSNAHKNKHIQTQVVGVCRFWLIMKIFL